MSIFGTETRYGSPAQLLHWLTAILVLAAFLVSTGGPESRVYGATNAANLQLHETLGLSVFAVVLVRLVWRFFDRTPADPPMPGWMALASRVSHWVLYALLLLVPLTALLGTQFAGHAVTTYFGTFGPVVAPSEAGTQLAEMHGVLGDGSPDCTPPPPSTTTSSGATACSRPCCPAAVRSPASAASRSPA